MDVSKLVRKNIKDLNSYRSARDEFSSESKKFIFLDANENPYGEKLNRYPDPQHNSLRNIFSKEKNVNSNQLIFGNGSDEIIDLVLRVFCEPGIDEAIIIPPTYGMFEVLLKLNNISIKKVNLDENYSLDLTSILKEINKKTKIIFLCSPNNPTGNSISIEKIINLLESFNGIVFLDEAYIHFSNKKSCISLIKKYKNLVVCQTFSKAYGLAGIRLGVCFADEKIVEFLNKIKPPYNINSFTQEEAIKNIETKNNLSKKISMILDQKNEMIDAMKNINFIKKIFPSDANFILIKVDDANKRYKQLLSNGIVVRNRTSLFNCNNTLRISVGSKEENLKLVKIFKKINT
jgi:histidinol-phosphate aminotransferase